MQLDNGSNRTLPTPSRSNRDQRFLGNPDGTVHGKSNLANISCHTIENQFRVLELFLKRHLNGLAGDTQKCRTQ